MTNVNIKLSGNGLIEVEGVKFTLEVIPHLVNPPENCLLSLKRVGSEIEVRRYNNAEAAAKFFAK
jgi:hypothetical protein